MWRVEFGYKTPVLELQRKGRNTLRKQQHDDGASSGLQGSRSCLVLRLQAQILMEEGVSRVWKTMGSPTLATIMDQELEKARARPGAINLRPVPAAPDLAKRFSKLDAALSRLGAEPHPDVVQKRRAQREASVPQLWAARPLPRRTERPRS